MNENETLVIVGGGPGGLSAARAYRGAGGRARVVLISAESYPPYRRPPLTKEYLRGELDRAELPIEGQGWFEEHGVELRLGTTVHTVDRGRGVARTGEGDLFPFDACVLATGSEPFRIPVPGADDPEVLVMRTIENSARLQSRADEGSRVVVVGSGFIGCEAAASLSMRGVSVTLVTQEEGPQRERLGEDVSGRIAGWLEHHGVNLRSGVNVEGIERKNGGFEVIIGGGERYDGEAVLLATGVTPRTRLAEEADLEMEAGGVVTDSSMRTSAPGIYAVGDIAYAYNEAAKGHQKVEHWGDALNHGAVAGTVIAGGEAAWDQAPGFWSTIGDKTLKYHSWSGGWDEAVFVDHAEEGGAGDESFTVWYGRDGELIGVLAHNHDEDYEEGKKLIERRAPMRRR